VAGGPHLRGDIVLSFDADIKLTGGAPLLTLFEKWPGGQFAASDSPSAGIFSNVLEKSKSPASQAGLGKIASRYATFQQNHYSRPTLSREARAEDDGLEP